MENTAPTNKKSFGVALWLVLLKIGGKFITVITKMSKLIFAGASIVAYSYIFTWQFALVLVAMIFIHEYGHLTAMKQCGMKTKGIYLIPFFGGAAITDDMFKSRRDESYIALMALGMDWHLVWQ